MKFLSTLLLLGSLASCVERGSGGADEHADGGSAGADDPGRVDDDGASADGSGGAGSCDMGEDEVESLVCGIDGAWAIGLRGDQLYWTLGASGNCPAGAPCGVPGLYRTSVTGLESATQIAAFDEAPMWLGVGDALVVATDSRVAQVGETGDILVLDEQGVGGLVVLGHEAFWVGQEDTTIWTTELPASDVANVELAVVGDPVVAFAASREALAWVTYAPGSADGSTLYIFDRATGEVIPAQSPGDLVVSLSLRGRRAWWHTVDGDIWSADDTGPPTLLVEGAVAFTVADEQIVYSTLDSDADTAEISRMSAAGGSPALIASFDASDLWGAAPVNLTVSDGYVYWSDRRIARALISR